MSNNCVKMIYHNSQFFKYKRFKDGMCRYKIIVLSHLNFVFKNT